MKMAGEVKVVGLIGATGGVGRLCAAALLEQVRVCAVLAICGDMHVLLKRNFPHALILIISGCLSTTKQGLSVRAIVRDTSKAKGLLPSTCEFVEVLICYIKTNARAHKRTHTRSRTHTHAHNTNIRTHTKSLTI